MAHHLLYVIDALKNGNRKLREKYIIVKSAKKQKNLAMNVRIKS